MSSGALNPTHSLTHYYTVWHAKLLICVICRKEIHWSGGWCVESWSYSVHSHYRLTAVWWSQSQGINSRQRMMGIYLQHKDAICKYLSLWYNAILTPGSYLSIAYVHIMQQLF